MTAKLRRWTANLALMTGSLAVTLLACEHVVFRYILAPDDVLHNVTIGGVVRYVPGSRAVMRHPDGTTSRVTINAQGWNATRPAYGLDKPVGVTRVAVIGDSYVHGAFVDVDKGFPEVLEQELIAHGSERVEVLRFGIDGAPMSQYLHMLRREVVKYRPDVVVIPIIHNDFDESYRIAPSRTGSSFMKLGCDPAGNVIEIAPADFEAGLADTLREARTFRYLYYKTNAYLTLKGLVSKLYWGGDADWKPEFVSSAVDIRNLRGQDAVIRGYTRYMLAELRALSEEHGFRLLLVMDGVREAVYAGAEPGTYEVGKLNVMMAGLTRETGVPFIDLHEAFARDWRRHGTRFEFPFDWHWNALGNDIVATTIADELMRAGPNAGLGHRPVYSSLR